MGKVLGFIQGWGGVGHVGLGWDGWGGVGWVIQGWGRVGHAGVGWGGSCRGGVGWVIQWGVVVMGGIQRWVILLGVGWMGMQGCE